MLFLWIVENALAKKWKIGEYFPETKLNLPIAILMVVFFLNIKLCQERIEKTELEVIKIVKEFEKDSKKTEK